MTGASQWFSAAASARTSSRGTMLPSEGWDTISCTAGLESVVTTGVPTIDYFISSRKFEPERAQEHYSEQLVQLEHLPTFIRRAQLPTQRKSLAELGLAAEASNGRHSYATRAQGREVLMTTTLDGRIKARLATNVADVREPVWGPYQSPRR